jgi:hypothetical protein
LPEGGARAVAGVGQYDAEPHTGIDEPVQFGQRDLALGAGHHPVVRHAGRRAALGIAAPRLGQEQP